MLFNNQINIQLLWNIFSDKNISEHIVRIELHIYYYLFVNISKFSKGSFEIRILEIIFLIQAILRLDM